MHREHRVDPRGSWVMGVGWKRDVTLGSGRKLTLFVDMLSPENQSSG